MDRQLKILTVQEVARYLRLHEITVYRMVQRGDLPALRVGRAWRFRKDQIDRWITDHEFHPDITHTAPHPAASAASRGRGRAR